MINLYPHQRQALEDTANNNKCAYYHDMGMGKTFTGAEKMQQLGARVNLVICQKSKIDDWIEHFRKYYSRPKCDVYDLTSSIDMVHFLENNRNEYFDDCMIGIINYELSFRRPKLLELHDFTLMLDESSLIQNETAKRTKFIMKLDYKNLILLSGTPTGGKYEQLWSQLNMLGYDISKKSFYNMYVDYHYDVDEGFPIMVIDGYKNVERLKRKMRKYGCSFLKSEEVLTLPDQIFTAVKVKKNSLYGQFMKHGIVTVDGVEIVGDTTLTKMLYARMLCGPYSVDKLEAFKELAESTEDRLIVFYNFNAELEALKGVCDALERPYSVVNGDCKDLYAYERVNASITLIQYQAGAMGLNLQKANKIIYFTPPLSSELYEQSKKRIHRIGQNNTCFYYNLICKGSIEEKIYRTLEMRKDYTDALFEMEGDT